MGFLENLEEWDDGHDEGYSDFESIDDCSEDDHNAMGYAAGVVDAVDDNYSDDRGIFGKIGDFVDDIFD